MQSDRMADVMTDEALDAAVWQVLGKGSLTARIRQEILRYIAERRLVAGDRLPSERALATLLQVSRPSVREAARALETEGRLVVRHGQGVYVAEAATGRRLRSSLMAQEHSLQELYSMREVLEVPAARWAAERGDRAALDTVGAALDDLGVALDRDRLRYDELQALDAAFHLRIVQASGNRFLEQTQGVLNDILRQGMTTTLRIPGRVERSRTDHRRIYRALLDGDSRAAAQAARAHVRGARKAATRGLSGSAGI